jgi:hypothetical protein
MDVAGFFTTDGSFTAFKTRRCRRRLFRQSCEKKVNAQHNIAPESNNVSEIERKEAHHFIFIQLIFEEKKRC